MSPVTPTLTVAIIARDEEQMIGDCLESVAWAEDKLVVVDAATKDRTREIARGLGARTVDRAFDNFAGQRDAALALASGDWVLFVDADERVRDPLRQEVLARVANPEGRVGFWIPRDNFLIRRVVRGAGWYPDYQLRLLRRSGARYDPRRVVHEVPMLEGPTGHLENANKHQNYRTLREFVAKQERYCEFASDAWLRTYGPPRARALVGQPLREFWRRYVSLGGYREGGLGLLLSGVLAWYTGKAVWRARQKSQATG